MPQRLCAWLGEGQTPSNLKLCVETVYFPTAVYFDNFYETNSREMIFRFTSELGKFVIKRCSMWLVSPAHQLPFGYTVMVHKELTF